MVSHPARIIMIAFSLLAFNALYDAIMNSMDREFIHGKTFEEIKQICINSGLSAYRAGQIWQWLYRKDASSWDQFTTLPQDFRESMARRFALSPVEIETVQGKPGSARKMLLGLHDGNKVETALIPGKNAGEAGKGSRRTVCLSTQVGCRFNCAFCASGKSGFTRDLESAEIMGQALAAKAEYGDKPTNVVFMGVGEPLDNYENTLRSIRIINDRRGLNIGARKITVSTCGLVPGIERLSGEGLQIELSVSLHAVSDEKRDKLMPVNRRYPLDELLAACRCYTEVTGRIVTFEYTLIRGFNALVADARQLADRLSSFPCRVNLIALSPVEEYSGEAPPRRTVDEFASVLNGAGINCTLRRSLGKNLDAACGQLRASAEYSRS